ncbi:MAG: carbohydrate binding domain-containing protein [Clostridia bacterium]|nr:carbohydrate binding domain-containing protein [Clostridia bacterium]
MDRLVLLIIFKAVFCMSLQADNYIPFTIPVEMSRNSCISYNYKPLSEEDRLLADGEKFVTINGKNIRIWGVNMSFGACFPTHADADRVSRRLAESGINSVRFHHMDTAKWPRGIWDKSGQDLHPEALDRLDYFIDQLAKCGIYSNINLHVGKQHSHDLDIYHSDNRELRYDKMISIFTPEIIQAHKEYARKILTRNNKYRNVRYSDDYAVAFVEITNENSLFMWSAESTLPNLPEYYARTLQKQYNKWLKNKYHKDSKLQNAWQPPGEPLSSNMLINFNFSEYEEGKAKNWVLEQHGKAKATLSQKDWKKTKCLMVKPLDIDNIEWHLQLNQRNLQVKENQIYTVTFAARSEKPRDLYISVGENHPEWENLGLAKRAKLEPNWIMYQYSFTAKKDDTNARLNFSFGKNKTPFYLANVQMQKGVKYKLDKNESLINNSISLYYDLESPERQADRMMFLAETEKSYFDKMYDYIKHNLGSRANVAGTIVFGPLGLWAQSRMDYIDSHAYWKHPRFPGEPWDMNNWLINQEAMSETPEKSTLIELASERPAGKPYTVSEYNHPAPLDSQAECVPMIVSWAAQQDWNGIWLYTYSHSNNHWDRTQINGFFDIDSNPAKWGFVRGGASIFRESSIDTYSNPRKFNFIQMGTPLLNEMAKAHLKYGKNMKELFISDLLEELPSKNTWGNGVYAITDSKGAVFSGKLNSMPKDMALAVNIVSPESTSILITQIYNDTQVEEYFITACGKCENPGMIFSANRNTIGKNWGHGPAHIETVDGTLSFKKFTKDKWKCYALRPDGTINNEVAINNGQIQLDSQYKTIWYLLRKVKIPKTHQ